MSLLLLDDVKRHLVITNALDDVVIQSYIDAAESYVAGYLRLDLAVAFPSGLPASIQQAVRMLVAQYFGTRGATSEIASTPVPFGVRDLLAEHRDLS